MKKLLAVLITILSLAVILTFSAINVSAETAIGYIVGDTDLDSEISIKDATMVQMYVAQLESLTEEEQKAADCDENEGLQIMDASIIQIYVAKMNMDYPKNIDGYKIGEVATPKSTLIVGYEFSDLLRTTEEPHLRKVVFDYKDNYADMKFSETINVDVKDTGEITLNISEDGNTAYILSENKIYANPDSSNMFQYLPQLETIEFKNFDTSDVTTMRYMFIYSEGIKSLDLSCFDTSNVTDFCGMFSYCNSLESLNVSSFDTSKATILASMFLIAIFLKLMCQTSIHQM